MEQLMINGFERDVVRYEGGGIREDPVGKGMYQYMSMVGLKRLGLRYEYGHRKYGASDNYKAGLPTDKCWNSAFRHLIAYMSGDNSEDHLAACAWNCFAIMEIETNKPEFQTIESRKQYGPEDLDYRGAEIV